LFYALHGHRATTNAAVFSKDEQGGKYLATAGQDRHVLVWEARFNEPSSSIEQGTF
jgi:WD40 repeat protein